MIRKQIIRRLLLISSNLIHEDPWTINFYLYMYSWGWCSAEMIHYLIESNAIQAINDARRPVLIFQSLAFLEVWYNNLDFIISLTLYYLLI